MTQYELIKKWRKQASEFFEKEREARAESDYSEANIFYEKAISYEDCANDLEALTY